MVVIKKFTFLACLAILVPSYPKFQVSGRTWNTQMIPLAMADAEQIKVFPLSAGSK
jgi:hypothetical protein